MTRLALLRFAAMGAAVALAIAAGPAVRAADTAGSQPLVIAGQVASTCQMSPATQGPGNLNVAFSAAGGGASQLAVNLMVDPSTARTQSVVGVVQFQVLCTGAHTLKVTSASGGLVNTTTTTTAGGFSTRADYSLQAAWAGASRSLTTSGSAASLDLSGADSASGALTVTVTVPSGEGPLVAGAYQDVISIDLSAN
ncbi:MAG TPA: hypothetical protein VGG29_05365 [Caulobacteraceae bacterium]|jgi:hypothetical protein